MNGWKRTVYLVCRYPTYVDISHWCAIWPKNYVDRGRLRWLLCHICIVKRWPVQRQPRWMILSGCCLVLSCCCVARCLVLFYRDHLPHLPSCQFSFNPINLTYPRLILSPHLTIFTPPPYLPFCEFSPQESDTEAEDKDASGDRKTTPISEDSLKKSLGWNRRW